MTWGAGNLVTQPPRTVMARALLMSPLPRTCSLSDLFRVLAALANHSRVEAVGNYGVGEQGGLLGASDGLLHPEGEMGEDPCAHNTFVGTTVAPTAGRIANFDLTIGASGRHAVVFSSPGLRSWVSAPNASGSGGGLFLKPQVSI